MEGPKVNMPNPDVSTAAAHRPDMVDCLFVTRTGAEHDRLVALLDGLIDEIGEDESHPLASLMEVLDMLIEQYEAEYVPELGTKAGIG